MGFPLPAALIARSGAVGEPRWAPDGRSLGWVEGFGGRADLVVAHGVIEQPAVATAETGVAGIGAYGGGVWCWVGPDHVAVSAADGRLVLLPAAGGPVRVLCDQGRASAPAASPDGTQLAFVLETDDTCDVAVVPRDGSEAPRSVSHADYAWDPAWSPDGGCLAWHEWDLTGMSWDASRIVVAAPDGSGARAVAGGADTSVGQPRFSPVGDALAYVSDADGWWNVWVADGDGANAAPLLAERFEHAEPAWGPGQRSFAWAPDGRAIALCRNERGFGRLVVCTRSGDASDVARGWHHGIEWGAGGIVAVRSGARTAPAVTVVEPDGSRRRVLASGAPTGFRAAGIAEPELVSWAGADGTEVHGLWFRPEHSALGPGSEPPVLIDVHGGPTGQAAVQWKPFHQYFVTRGWAVLAPDPRGSTGHGRVYAQALAGEWGALDVADCAAMLGHIGPEGWGDPVRVAVSGASSGGLTAMLLAALHGAHLRALISRYGVTDLLGLAATTHRFESRYLDRLVGELPRDADRYRERSPVAHAAAIRVPTLVLHGDADRVVPPAQAAAVVDAIRQAGGTVEHHVYEGEGHGFARVDTVLDVYERIESFLQRHVLA
jgi:dipeptidyl aminopeptidase/acylaminoacyl peptidase